MGKYSVHTNKRNSVHERTSSLNDYSINERLLNERQNNMKQFTSSPGSFFTE